MLLSGKAASAPTNSAAVMTARAHETPNLAIILV